MLCSMEKCNGGTSRRTHFYVSIPESSGHARFLQQKCYNSAMRNVFQSKKRERLTFRKEPVIISLFERNYMDGNVLSPGKLI